VRRLVPYALPLGLLLPLLYGAGAASALPGTACPAFPADNVWHADVSALPVHPRSAAWVASAGGATKKLHPDFGPSGDPNVPYGIPFQVVPSSHAKVNVAFDYADESDAGPYPLGPDTPIEGGAGSGGDMHTVVVDTGTCRLYETWYTQHQTSGWTAGSGATWDLRSNALRPNGWTSADAAGLPILPGLLRLDEVRAGHVDHAIRFTVGRTDRTYLWPARHQAGAANDANLPPMGARFRLKKSYATSGLRADTQVVLAAMKTYGLLLADNGSDWFFQGDAQDAWPTALLDQLKAVPASAFEAIDESSLMVSADSAAVRTKAPAPRWTHWAPPKATTAPPARHPKPKATTGRATPGGSPAPAAPSTTPAATPSGPAPPTVPGSQPNALAALPTGTAEPPPRGRGGSRTPLLWLLPLLALGGVAGGRLAALRRTR
jgi:hypothetical protein